MRITIKRWGNSAGMVIPNIVMKELNLQPGQSVEAQVSNNQLILTPISRRYSLDELLAQSDLISLHCPLTERNLASRMSGVNPPLRVTKYGKEK